MYDVTIIGAGVAGIFLAHQLVEDGQRVLLLDAGVNERQKMRILDSQGLANQKESSIMRQDSAGNSSQKSVKRRHDDCSKKSMIFYVHMVEVQLRPTRRIPLL